jgi:hypothetical protein
MLWLDFDGVLANSADECLYLVESVNGNLSVAEKNIFLKKRYLVNEPYGFFILADLCRSGLNGLDFEVEYKARYKKYRTSEIEEIHDVFFEQRRALMSADLGYWCQINSPTPFFNELKLLKINPAMINIISTKNFGALKAWLEFYKFEVADIFGNEEYRRFKNKFNIIKNQSDLPSIFIDDNCVHIDNYDWTSIHCKAIFAGWGYNKCLTDNTRFVLEVIKSDLCN